MHCILYNRFCVLSFHSVLCFPNDYHMVKEEKLNINDLKNINYNKVNVLFFLSVSKVCARLICSGGICPGGICLGGKCPKGYMSWGGGGKCPGGICPGGTCLGSKCPGGICPRG